MNKAGFKTFVLSFALTLSAILGADRAFVHTPNLSKEPLKIHPKNITLFFTDSHSKVVASSQTEPVYKNILKETDPKQEETIIAQNISSVSKPFVVSKEEIFP